MERAMGIEPTTSAWKAEVIPLNYTRIYNWSERQDLNLRHPAPKAGALPSCATPRYCYNNKIIRAFRPLVKAFSPRPGRSHPAPAGRFYFFAKSSQIPVALDPAPSVKISLQQETAVAQILST
jgi:hypothetical protein